MPLWHAKGDTPPMNLSPKFYPHEVSLPSDMAAADWPTVDKKSVFTNPCDSE